jgi:hypothetical protein
MGRFQKKKKKISVYPAGLELSMLCTSIKEWDERWTARRRLNMATAGTYGWWHGAARHESGHVHVLRVSKVQTKSWLASFALRVLCLAASPFAGRSVAVRRGTTIRPESFSIARRLARAARQHVRGNSPERVSNEKRPIWLVFLNSLDEGAMPLHWFHIFWEPPKSITLNKL